MVGLLRMAKGEGVKEVKGKLAKEGRRRIYIAGMTIERVKR